ncbi:MAG: hypothetical protein J2P31_19415, partial [Blastocatellia bacterium]|nr:hypothetical protein [Blastocatellia bacterium]
MKINCPKCQFENQADSTRIVCARCATIIEVRLDQGSSADTNGKRQTARLPFGFSSGNNQGSTNQQLNDVYATRLGDDFDDVLDIPRPEQPSYQSGGYGESPSVYDDVFASPSYDSSSGGFEYSNSDRRSSPLETFRPGASRQRESQEYINEAEPEFMGWPVLPDDSKGPEGGEKAFSPYDGLLTRLVSTVLIFGVIVAVAFYIVYNNRSAENKAANVKQPVPKEETAKNEQASSSEGESKSTSAAEPKTQPEQQAARSSSEKAVDIPPQTRGVAENTQPQPSSPIPNRGE